MASKEPQSLPAQGKTTDPAPVEEPVEEMEVDEPAAKTVNGDATSHKDFAEPEAAPVTNGHPPKPQKASHDEAKKSTSEEPPPHDNMADSDSLQPAVQPPATVDTEMTGSNGTTEADESQSVAGLSPAKSPEKVGEHDDKVVVSNGSSSEEAEVPPKETSAEIPTPAANPDPMDIDASTEHVDLESSGEHGDNTQNTSTVSDAPVALSVGSSQPADLSKLEIGASHEEESVAKAPGDGPATEFAASPPKVSREREEDDAEEPAAKRAKTEDTGEDTMDSLVVATNPDASTEPAGSEALGNAIPDDLPITPWQNKRTREVLGNVKKTKNGGNFKKSVQELWPALWNDYSAKIDNPVDISSMEAKLREDRYTNYGQFKADVNQLYENAVLFNGPLHEVSLAAAQVRDYILVRMPEVIHTKAPAKHEKGKGQPTRHAEPRAVAQPRRPSNSQSHPPAASPKSKPEPSSLSAASSSTAQAFAIPPSGIPQIRRDSTREDHDRPKRPIHPPKNRDPEYASKASRKKKLDPEQRFFDIVLEEVKKAKYYNINQWFLAAVDPVALNIPNYFKVIKKPMDLATMTEKNYDGEYKAMKDLEKDMRLIVHNSEMFNGPDHEVTHQAKQLEELLKVQLAGKDRWMERHYPSATPSAMHTSAASPERSIAESDDDSEGDGDEEDNDAIQGLQQRLNEEQGKLNQMLNAKKPDLTMVEVQQSMVTLLQRKLVEERTKFHNEKRPKKKKSSSKSKSKTGGSSSLGNKRLSGSVSTSKKPVASNKKPAAPKKRTMGALEKAVIAEGIGELDGNTLTKAVDIIKRDTGQNENDDGEMELDIDSLSFPALEKLYDLINKAHPHVRQNIAKKPEYSNAVSSEAETKPRPGGLPKAKKNKPMNKHEQERKIEQLRELRAQLQRHGSGSQEPLPELEAPAAAESSESSDSEEE
ncbi:hypothetical protein F4802DRAFT_601283 [Xylaria palmicola]|nr:hypothetical protein F4802DRAFT_601283 [Xylaria palmicola]